MAIVTKSVPVAALMMFMAMAPGPAQAQDERLRVSFTPGAATVGGDAELAWSGSFGYRFSEHFWFEGDFSWIDAAAGGLRDRAFELDGRQMGMGSMTQMLTRGNALWSSRQPGVGGPGFITIPGLPTLPNLPGAIGPLNASTDGQTMIATIGIRYEFPVQTERFRPYVSGGMGINNTDQEFRLESTPFTAAIDESVSHTGYALGAGVGGSVRLFSQLWADVDARYFRLSRERNVMRFGGGVSFRF